MSASIERQYLTSVELRYVEGACNYRLIWGLPVRTIKHTHHFGEGHESALFSPGSIFALDLWDRNEYGTIRWRIFILQAGTVGDTVQPVPHVHPGAHVLLHTEGTRRCKLLVQWLRLVEADGDPTSRPPAFWQARDHMIKGLPARWLTPRMLHRLEEHLPDA
ncbi:MAG: DUF2840 domain-containing protein [Betaproteobacteria bacterium]|nr:DUF2840 domain-containing protein [Betaproteobacteria bacterium]